MYLNLICFKYSKLKNKKKKIIKINYYASLICFLSLVIKVLLKTFINFEEGEIKNVLTNSSKEGMIIEIKALGSSYIKE